MTHGEKLDRLDGIYAHDMGCFSSGIKDEAFKKEMQEDTEQLERLITDLVRSYARNGDYGFEDIASLVKWADEEMGLSY